MHRSGVLSGDLPLHCNGPELWLSRAFMASTRGFDRDDSRAVPRLDQIDATTNRQECYGRSAVKLAALSNNWLGLDGEIAAAVQDQSERCLAAYREDPNRVLSDANLEVTTAEGGYGRKQIYELIQNGADALLGGPGRIEVLLSRDVLYVANQGSAITRAGVEALLGSHLSQKRNSEIGRFGLGFKSVVGVSDTPQIFSCSGSFGFDRARARARVSTVVPDARRYPVLRLAEPLDPAVQAEQDPELAQLMEWATTVVRLPLKTGQELLGGDLKTFPAEFLLFSPHVTDLHLVDRVAKTSRVIQLTMDPRGELNLLDGGTRRTWRVVRSMHRPSTDAARDAGEIANRESIVLHWAVPTQGRGRVGRFWAFFPTESMTTLSGIVNAPWKLSDDRRNLLEGAFNREVLIEALPRLLEDNLPGLVEPDDPASVLDLLPARGKEPRNWADRDINGPVFDRLSRTRSLPDLHGVLRRPADLRLHPSGLQSHWLEDWRLACTDGESWVHHDVDKTPERRLKAERLMGSVESRRPDLTQWLEALCARPSPASSGAAVALVASLASGDTEQRAQSRQARVLLLEDGRLVPPRAGTVFVRASKDEGGYDFIDPRLVALPGVGEALAKLGIKVLDRSGELRNALAKADQRAIDWERVWTLTRQLPLAVSVQILHEGLRPPLARHLQVRTAEGRWVPVGAAFLGGGVVPADGSRDKAFLISPQYHREDEELLLQLGALSQPSSRRDAPGEPWFVAYRDSIVDDFIGKAAGSKPSRERIVTEGTMPPWPLDAISRMSPAGRLAMTNAALTLDDGTTWTVRHQTNSSYGRRKYRSPVTWLLRRHGVLSTRLGPWPLTQCLRPDRDLPEHVLPVADVTTATADRFKLLAGPEELSAATWSSLLGLSSAWQEAGRRYELYSWAVHFAPPPSKVRVALGQRTLDLDPQDVAVVADVEVLRALQEQQIPAIQVPDPDDVLALQQSWGMAEGASLLQQELVPAPVGEPAVLVDRFPFLRLYLDPASSATVQLQFCSSIQMVTATPRGQVTRPVPGALVDGRVLVTASEPASQLEQISQALKLELAAADIRSILDQQERQQAQELVVRLRAARDLHERLAVAVGPDQLRRALPAAALEAIEADIGQPLSSEELARLAYSVHGVATLQHFRSVLEERGLNPPVQWAGGATARRFVTDLGFPSAFAGFSADRRPAVFDVEGPAELGPLHDYQTVVTDRIKALLAGQGPARGIVSLPTGAGKTRVAVQALVDELREERLQGPVVWIAQSDELCEQAVQTWAYVWRALGPRRRMIISRFWSTNEVTEETDAFQLVVATTDKLNLAVGKTAYAWMSEASVVVVDEAHASVAPTYTRVLEWLGRGRARTPRRPLIGLTATPFRNTNSVETERLVARYDANRLDAGAFQGEPYAELQARGVLAKVEQNVLDGIDVQFTADDLVEIDRYKRMPSGVEARLGKNLDRNRMIVESVLSLPKDWPVLLFATSVENARALAAQIAHGGIHAVAISAETEPAARRHYIEQFQAGELRVITNYGVLAQGFDAPAVRAVYVTRPTFSTNLYQQMIGRGLRGPRNGGSEQVRIVNVRDNLQQYGDRLAFYDFEHLWTAPVG